MSSHHKLENYHNAIIDQAVTPSLSCWSPGSHTGELKQFCPSDFKLNFIHEFELIFDIPGKFSVHKWNINGVISKKLKIFQIEFKVGRTHLLSHPSWWNKFGPDSMAWGLRCPEGVICDDTQTRVSVSVPQWDPTPSQHTTCQQVKNNTKLGPRSPASVEEIIWCLE